jgi:hypothetical protein
MAKFRCTINPFTTTIPFKTTPEQVMTLASIMVEMRTAGVAPGFIVEVSELARMDQGVYDLMALWLAAKTDTTERDEIIADLQEALDDYADAPALERVVRACCSGGNLHGKGKTHPPLPRRRWAKRQPPDGLTANDVTRAMVERAVDSAAKRSRARRPMAVPLTSDERQSTNAG